MNISYEAKLEARAWIAANIRHLPSALEFKTVYANFLSAKLEKIRRTYRVPVINSLIEVYIEELREEL